MKILFVAEQLYLPQLYGGVQTSTDELCHAMMQRGHAVSLLFKAMPGGLFGLRTRLQMKLSQKHAGFSVSSDRGFGYPVWRAWFPKDVVAYVCQRESPDLIVVMTGGDFLPLAFAAQATGIPLLVQLHDIGGDHDGYRRLGDLPYVANSRFTATVYREDYGIESSVINPFISLERYRLGARRSRNATVTMINPVPEKGVAIAVEIARRCPDIPFRFIEGWTLSPAQRQALAQRMAGVSNIVLAPSQRDMRKVYDDCRILLVPSMFPETFGRVTAEAQANAIPVVASTRGGLPDSVGPGGILLDPEDSMEDWVAAIRALWSDARLYDSLSAKALSHAARIELNRDYQADLWCTAFAGATRRQRPAHAGAFN